MKYGNLGKIMLKGFMLKTVQIVQSVLPFFELLYKRSGP